jgi:hypothetical protein
MATEREDAVWLHAESAVTIVELAACSGLTEDEVRELVDAGVAAPSADCIPRLRSARRIQRDLELEPHALALLVAFLERIDALEAEIRNLNAQLQFPRHLR